MQGWGAPMVASAFWAGVLLSGPPARPATTWPWWAWLLLGCVALTGAAAVAPGRRGDDPLRTSGLTDDDPVPAVAAVTPRATDHRRGPGPAIALVVAGVLLCGVGWAGLGAVRAEHSLLRRLAPRTVTLLATLREDPEPSAYGWHALVDVTRASWPGGAAAVRETVWVSGNDAMPEAVRGDRLEVQGTLQIPDDPGFAATLAHRGLAVSVRAIEVQRLGGASSPFVRMTQVVRAFVGDTIERIFPPREAGLLLGLVLGDASKLDPVTTRDFQTTGLGHLLVVSGENVAMVLAPVAGVRRRAAASGRVGALRARVRRRVAVRRAHRRRTVGAPCGGDGVPRADRASCWASRVRPVRSWPRPCWRCWCWTRGSSTRSGSSCPSRRRRGWWCSPRRSPNGSAGGCRRPVALAAARRWPPSSA